MRLRLATASVLAACAMAGGLATSAQAMASADAHSASAAARPACPYPYVCFYNGNTMTGRFKDTGYWQTLGASRSAKGAMNTRHDDVAYVRFSNHKTICMKPREGWAFNGAKPTQVYISTRSVCPS
ncbi:hypothetical protein [Streptomyces sp. NRRL F-5126]|uniref:hypothetical protein n=1 Tax=Streptomyces sp. NRRL F-5126 TaxID=1463857 RepID=UPI0004C80A06|nr:hypothetical protein [Streptomyces sp. NRRL F-5126]